MPKPQHAEHPGDCTFLGTKGRFDLYFGSQGLQVPIVIARRGSGNTDFQEWPIDLAPRSTVLQEVFHHAVRLALQQGLFQLK